MRCCRSCLISDGERQNGTLSEECVVTTEVGWTHPVEVLPSQQMFDVKVFVTLTPSERSHRPPLAPLVEAVTSYYAIEQGLPISPLSELILHRHITPLGLCAHVPASKNMIKTTSFLLASLLSRFLASSGPHSPTSVIQQRPQALRRIPEYVCRAMFLYVLRMKTQCVAST